MLPFQPGVWLIAGLQVLMAWLILTGRNWARWFATAATLGFFLDSLVNQSWPGKYATFPAAAVRDAVSYAIQHAAIALLFLPSSTTWFRHVRNTGDA